mgnify:CR=1 FL=1
MAITLRSPATGDLILLNDLAKALLGRLGKDASQPGILEPQDMADALRVLQALPDESPQADVDPTEDGQRPGEPGFADEIVPLRRRAVPLMRMIEQAQAEDKPIVWGV